MPEQASSGHSFQLGILSERKIDRRALAASYGFVVLLALLLINLGMLFPDRLQLKQYRVTSLIPMPALRPEHVPVNRKPLKSEAASSRASFSTAEVSCAARGPAYYRPRTGGSA